MSSAPVRCAILILLLPALASAQTKPADGSTIKMDPCGMVMSAGCGHVSGNVYHNEYFGISYTFPENWNPLPQELLLSVHQQKAEQDRKEAIAKNPGKPVYLFETWDLFIATRLALPPPSDSNVFNSNIVLWADELSQQVHTPADQLSGFTQEPGTKLLKPLTHVTLSGREFLRADRLDHTPEGDVYHARIITFMRYYAVGADFYSGNAQELETMAKTLESLQFEVQPDTGSISGASYHNPFFGFTYQMPEGFTAQDEYQTRLEHLLNRTQMPELAAMPQVTMIYFTNYDLLVASHNSASADPKAVTPWLRVWAEKNFLNRAPEDYFANSRFLMDEDIKDRKMPAKLMVGGRTFSKAERWGKAQGTRIYEARAATVVKNLTLVFEFGAGSQKELDDLIKSLGSVKFE